MIMKEQKNYEETPQFIEQWMEECDKILKTDKKENRIDEPSSEMTALNNVKVSAFDRSVLLWSHIDLPKDYEAALLKILNNELIKCVEDNIYNILSVEELIAFQQISDIEEGINWLEANISVYSEIVEDIFEELCHNLWKNRHMILFFAGKYRPKEYNNLREERNLNTENNIEQGEEESAKRIKVVFVEPGGEPEMREIGTDYMSLMKAVDGPIEVFAPLSDPICIVYNEKAHVRGLPVNRLITNMNGDVLATIDGNFFICDLSGSMFEGLPDEQIKRYIEMFTADAVYTKYNGQIIIIRKPNDTESHDEERIN